MKYSLAIDIGASSGCHIVGWMENGRLNTMEIVRCGKPADGAWFPAIQKYETEVLEARA